MGADIHGFVEVRDAPGVESWHLAAEEVEFPFGWRSYSMFGFLTGIRNYSHCPTVCGEKELRGLPTDSAWLNSRGGDSWYKCTVGDELISDGDYHSFHWVRLDELLNFDYDQQFEDLRYTKWSEDGRSANGAAVAIPGDGNGTWTTMREHLGESFFTELEKLKDLGNPEDVRIIMWFDN